MCLLFGQDAYHYNVTGVRVIVVCPGLLQHDASSPNFGNRFKSPSHEKAWQLIDMKGVHPQKYVNFRCVGINISFQIACIFHFILLNLNSDASMLPKD